jgi:hypothetical protein
MLTNQQLIYYVTEPGYNEKSKPSKLNFRCRTHLDNNRNSAEMNLSYSR